MLSYRNLFGWLTVPLAAMALSACSLDLARGDGPTLKRLFPAGAGRGQSIEVTTQGDAPKWPVDIWCDDPLIKWEALADKGKFRVTVDAAAAIGVHHVRFHDAENATDGLRFIVGSVPEQNEVEPNDSVKDAKVIASLPTVVNGLLEKRGSVDTFAVELEENQRLLALVEANENLRSPVDVTLQVLSSRGTVLAQNLDSLGLDPLIEFRAVRKERYLVRVFGFPETPDSTIGFAGSDNFVYRLKLTTGPWVKATRPLGLQRGGQTTLSLLGGNLQQTELPQAVPPTFTGVHWTLDSPGLTHAPQLDVLDWPQAIEPERKEGAADPSIAVPGSLTGVISTQKERDLYSFEASKDKKLSITLTSRRLGLPMDGVLRVLDTAGKQIAREDDTSKQSDTQVVFQPPADGKYVLEVTDAVDYGGPEWIYRIDIQAALPEVSLSVKADHFSGKINEVLEIPVTIDRKNGFDKLLSVEIEGLPPEVECQAEVSDKEASAKEVKLTVKSAAAFRGKVRVVVKPGEASDRPLAATASGDSLLSDLWLTIH